MNNALFLLGLAIALASAAAFPNVPLGIYSAFTETDWGMAFELKKGGRAIVTTEHSSEVDDDGKRLKHDVNVPGKWKLDGELLTLRYLEYEDCFEYRTDCYESRPCFKFKKAQAPAEKKSPLNVTFAFINWYAKAAPAKAKKKK